MFEEEESALPLSYKAYEQLRDQIVRLVLAPGELLDESTLVKQLGLGRTPVREALQRLACEGLVVIRPRRGTFVANLSLTDLQQIFELRQEIEGFAAALAAERASEVDIASLEKTLARLEQTPRDASASTYIEIDRAFHRALAQSTHNRFLEDSLKRMYELNLRLWYFALHRIGPMRDAIEEHRALVAAIKCHDRRMAEATLRKHIAEFQARIREII